MNGHYYHNELKSQVCKAITALFIYLKKPPHTYITKHTNRDRNISYEWYGSMWLTRIRQTSDAYYQKDPIYKTEILALGTYIQVSALFWVGFIPNYKQLNNSFKRVRWVIKWREKTHTQIKLKYYIRKLHYLPKSLLSWFQTLKAAMVYSSIAGVQQFPMNFNIKSFTRDKLKQIIH